jgi:hypothetical protein
MKMVLKTSNRVSMTWLAFIVTSRSAAFLLFCDAVGDVSPRFVMIERGRAGNFWRHQRYSPDQLKPITRRDPQQFLDGISLVGCHLVRISFVDTERHRTSENSHYMACSMAGFTFNDMNRMTSYDDMAIGCTPVDDSLASHC